MKYLFMFDFEKTRIVISIENIINLLIVIRKSSSHSLFSLFSHFLLIIFLLSLNFLVIILNRFMSKQNFSKESCQII